MTSIATVSGPIGPIQALHAGPESAPDVVFLHGYPDDHRVWKHQFDALRSDFHVIAFDWRGVGRSAAVRERGEWRADRVVQDLHAVVDTLAPGRRVHLVGHDWGSVLGWCAVADPTRANRFASFLSISGSHPGIFAAWLRRGLRSQDPQERRAARLQLRRSWYVLLFQVPGLAEFGWRRRALEIYRRALEQGGVPRGDELFDATRDDVLARALAPIKLYRSNRGMPAPELASIAVPVRVVVARLDPFVTPEAARAGSPYTRQFDTIDIDASHWAQRSHPELINTAIGTFVSENISSQPLPRPS